jgi:long-chain acyl-CoA synthetase
MYKDDRQEQTLSKAPGASGGTGAPEGKRIEFESIAEMVRCRAEEIPHERLVLYYDEVVTYAQTNDRANSVAHYLKEKGVGKGDIVSVMILNSPEIYYTMFGVQKLGAVAGAVNYMLKGPEIAYVLEDSKPKVAFVGSEYMAEFARGWEQSTHKPVVIEVVTGIDHGAAIAEGNLKEILDRYPTTECLVPQSLDDPVMLLYSSGTTGMPKGILLSNRNELAICKGKAVFGTSQPGDVVMIILPMFHVNPLCVWTYPTIYLGLTLCIRRTFSPKDFWPSLTRMASRRSRAFRPSTLTSTTPPIRPPSNSTSSSCGWPLPVRRPCPWS